MKLFLSTALFILTFETFAQSGSAGMQRASYILKVAVNKDSVYEYNIQGSPFILRDNVIQLYTNETILVEIEQINSQIKNMKVVPRTIHPDKTIKISFTQSSQNGVHQNMVLQISNPFTKNLSYSARILLANPKKWIKTDVVPIEAGIYSYETWPDIIVSIVLGDWIIGEPTITNK